MPGGIWNIFIMKTRHAYFGRKLLIPALTAVLLFSALFISGCSEVRIASGIDKTYLLTVNNSVCTKKEAVFMLMEEKLLYDELRDDDIWSRKIGSYTMSEYVKELIQERLIKYTCASSMSDAMSVYPSDEEKAYYAELAAKSWERVSAVFDVSEYDITKEDVEKLYRKEAIYSALLNNISENATEGITEESCRVIAVDYGVIPKDAGYDRADALRNEVKAGADLQEVINNEGYTFHKNEAVKRGDVNEAFDTVAFALYDGEMSEVVESREYYYIIRCIDDKLVEESMANYAEQVTGARENAFVNKYLEFAKTAKLSFDSAYWKDIKIGDIK